MFCCCRTVHLSPNFAGSQIILLPVSAVSKISIKSDHRNLWVTKFQPVSWFSIHRYIQLLSCAYGRSRFLALKWQFSRECGNPSFGSHTHQNLRIFSNWLDLYFLKVSLKYLHPFKNYSNLNLRFFKKKPFYYIKSPKLFFSKLNLE